MSNVIVHWTDDEDLVLKTCYSTLGPRGVSAMIPRRSHRAIVLRARRMGLRGKCWTAREDAVIRLVYPDSGGQYIQDKYLPWRSVGAIRDRAGDLRVSRYLEQRHKAQQGDMLAAQLVLQKAWGIRLVNLGE
tara:strand:+ start:297 stop:692 length:396 start_codon:yes stop_codon:yes gene_type:complete